MEPIVNRVAESDIEVFNLESIVDFESFASFDIAPFLDNGFILREKNFRKAVAEHDWSGFHDKNVAVHCSTDAIIPSWAYMLVAVALRNTATRVVMGSESGLVQLIFREKLAAFDWSVYQDKIVVVKGCGSQTVPEDAYVAAVKYLTSVAKKIMYGEPCSSVPLWRRKTSQSKSAKPASAVKPAVIPSALPRPSRQ